MKARLLLDPEWSSRTWQIGEDIRSGDNDLRIHKMLVESRTLTLLVGGGHKLVPLTLDPLPQAELILGGSEELGDLFGMLVALYWS